MQAAQTVADAERAAELHGSSETIKRLHAALIAISHSVAAAETEPADAAAEGLPPAPLQLQQQRLQLFTESQMQQLSPPQRPPTPPALFESAVLFENPTFESVSGSACREASTVAQSAAVTAAQAAATNSPRTPASSAGSAGDCGAWPNPGGGVESVVDDVRRALAAAALERASAASRIRHLEQQVRRSQQELRSSDMLGQLLCETVFDCDNLISSSISHSEALTHNDAVAGLGIRLLSTELEFDRLLSAALQLHVLLDDWRCGAATLRLWS